MSQKASNGFLTYVFDGATGLDAVAESHPLILVRILPGDQDVLVPGVVWTFVQHPAATLHLDGVAATQVRAKVWAVSAALEALPKEILILEECNLDGGKQGQTLVN